MFLILTLISAHLKAHGACETRGEPPNAAPRGGRLLSELQRRLEFREASGGTCTLGIVFPKSCNEIGEKPLGIKMRLVLPPSCFAGHSMQMIFQDKGQSYMTGGSDITKG